MSRAQANPAAALMSRAADRKYPRVRVGLPPCNAGQLLDLSPGGARVRCARRSSAAAGSRLILAIGEGDEALELECRVVWLRPAGFWNAEMGLEFPAPVDWEGGLPRPHKLPPAQTIPRRKAA